MSAFDGSTDASSVGDSTVRQLDDQIEQTGIQGTVRAATSTVQTTTFSEWQQSRKRTRKSSKSSGSSTIAGNSMSNKKGRVVTIKGVNLDIAKVASKQTIDFSSFVRDGDVRGYSG